MAQTAFFKAILKFCTTNKIFEKSLYFGGLQSPSPSLGHKRYFRPPQEEVFYSVISSDLFPLNDPDIPTLLHRSSGSRSSPDISFTPFSLALSCSWEVLQDLGSDHVPVLQSISLTGLLLQRTSPILQFSESLLG